MPLVPGTNAQSFGTPSERSAPGVPNGPAIYRTAAARSITPPRVTPAPASTDVQGGAPDANVRAAQPSHPTQTGTTEAGAPDLTLQRSASAAAADAPAAPRPFPLAAGASIAPDSATVQRSAALPTPATPAGAAPSTPAQTLPAGGDTYRSTTPVAQYSQPGAPAPPAEVAPAVVARTEAAPADFTNLDLVAPGPGTDRTTEGIAAVTATNGPPGSAVPPALDLALPAAQVASGRVDRGVDTSQRGQAAAPSQEAAPATAITPVPATAGPSTHAGSMPLDLAAASASSTARRSAAIESAERAVQRAVTPAQKKPLSEPSGPAVMATSGSSAVDAAPPPLELALPVGTAPPSAGSPMQRAVAPVPAAAGTPQGSSAIPVIARTVASPPLGLTQADLPLAAAAVAEASADRRAPTATAFVRAAAPFELVSAPDSSRRAAEVSRSVAPAQSSSSASSSGAPLDQPLFAPAAQRPPAADSAPTPAPRFVASAESPSQQLQRNPDMPLSIEPATETVQRSLDAFGEVTSIQQAEDEPAQSQEISEANLEQITEHVWQFVRKELRVERERQRGQA